MLLSITRTEAGKPGRPGQKARSRHQRGGAQRWQVHSAHSVPAR
jgi:hypothetical protein